MNEENDLSGLDSIVESLYQLQKNAVLESIFKRIIYGNIEQEEDAIEELRILLGWEPRP